MKILLINDNHELTGGAESYFFELKNRLQQAGLTVYSIGFGKQEQEGKDFFIFKALQSNSSKLAGRFISHPLLLKRLKQRIALFQPDVIHLHNIKQYTATILKAVKPYAVVQTVHDFSLICPTAQNIHRDFLPCATGLRKCCYWQHRVKFNFLTYLLISLAWQKTNKQLQKIVKSFIAPSPFLKNYLENNQFIPAHAVLPFNQGLTEPAYDNIQPYEFLFAGSLAKHKGIHYLLDEFALAKKQNSLLTLSIAGTGTLEHEPISDGVRLLGWQADLTPYYQKAAALIFPSIGLESFGLVVSEAMSHGRPVIGVNRGTTAWLIEDGKTGLLYDPLKKGDLAEKILKLANNIDQVKQFGKAGQERIAQLLNNEIALQEIISIYKSATK